MVLLKFNQGISNQVFSVIQELVQTRRRQNVKRTASSPIMLWLTSYVIQSPYQP
jgi:hypothetical protein